MKENSELKKLSKTQNDQKTVFDSEKQNQSHRLQNEKLFEMGYKDLLRANPFWLEGKTPKQQRALMEKYVNDFYLAYGSYPAWHSKPDSNNLIEQDRINLHNFRIEMKFIHKNR